MPSTEMSLKPQEIDELFETATEIEGSISEFVSSLHEQWEAKSYLSEKQISALQNIVEKHEARRR